MQKIKIIIIILILLYPSYCFSEGDNLGLFFNYSTVRKLYLDYEYFYRNHLICKENEEILKRKINLLDEAEKIYNIKIIELEKDKKDLLDIVEKLKKQNIDLNNQNKKNLEARKYNWVYFSAGVVISSFILLLTK